MSKLTISVITPVLDEERGIKAHVRRLTQLNGLHEILVVDGGSSDATMEIARAAERVRVLEASPSRASQMNAGARAATGDVLLFLHADVALPPDAPLAIGEALADAAVVAGAFVTRTVPSPGGIPLGPLLRLADLRSRFGRLLYGDQAIFVRAEIFRRLGGYADIPLMEDIELSRRLRQEGRIARVRSPVHVSGRRFQARPLTYTLMVNVYPLLYRLGVPPRLLARYYDKVR